MSMWLSELEQSRYSRHLLMPDVGEDGQHKLKNASVLLVGLGGLGVPVAQYLTAAGVGRLGLSDGDVVDLSNLQRQVLYGTQDIGARKVVVAAEKLQQLNPHVQFESFSVPITAENALELCADYDVVVDATDNFPTRYVLNDACVLTQKPLVHASIYRWEGQVSVLAQTGSACYRCLFPIPPPPELVPSCTEAGVLGVLPGIIGSFQAAEVLKLLLGIGQPLWNTLLTIDVRRMEIKKMTVAPDPKCPICGEHPTQTTLLADYEAFCGVSGVPETHIDVPTLKKWLRETPNLLLLDVREPEEFETGHINGRSVPLGTLCEWMTTSGIPAYQRIVVHCQSGLRSRKAVELLHGMGYTNVFHLQGGYWAWKTKAIR